MGREIDFATLQPRDALDLAILIEEEAEERYLELAEQLEEFETPVAASFFRMMAGSEARHGRALRGRRRAAYADAPSSVDRTMLWDVEAPAYEKARAFMSVRRALEVALESETKAHDFFKNSTPHLRNPEVKALFEELRLEEVEHQSLVREEMAKYPPDDGVETDTFVDEPDEM